MLYYKFIIVNPNSSRPCHITLGPDTDPTFIKILAPPQSPISVWWSCTLIPVTQNSWFQEK